LSSVGEIKNSLCDFQAGVWLGQVAIRIGQDGPQWPMEVRWFALRVDTIDGD